MIRIIIQKGNKKKRVGWKKIQKAGAAGYFQQIA